MSHMVDWEGQVSGVQELPLQKKVFACYTRNTTPAKPREGRFATYGLFVT